MTTFTSVFVSAAVLQGILSQTIPPECTKPPEELDPKVVDYPHLCCKTPFMFTDEDYTTCKKTPGKDDFPRPLLNSRVKWYNIPHRFRLRNRRSILSERNPHDTLCIRDECQRDLLSKKLTEEMNFELFRKTATNNSTNTIRNFMKNIAARLRWQNSRLHPFGRQIQVNTEVGEREKRRKLKEKHSQNVECPDSLCLLRQQGVVINGKLDKNNYAEFFDNFVAKNPTFGDVIALVKQECLKEGRPFDPHCEPVGAFMCARDHILMNCPDWSETEECQKLKKHMDHCKSHWSSLVKLL